MHKLFGLALAALLAMAAPAMAQSTPGFVPGQVPTAAQWNSYFAAKQDLLTLGTAARQNTGTSGNTIPFLSGNNTFGGPDHFTSSLFADADFYLSNAITPSTISGNVNDYAPTGNASAVTFRLSASSGPFSITGLGNGFPGRVVIIQNVGGADFVLAEQSSSSAAANRFELGTSGDVTIPPNQSMVLTYDGTSSRWRGMGGFASGIASVGVGLTLSGSVVSNITSRTNPSTATGNFSPACGDTKTAGASYFLATFPAAPIAGCTITMSVGVSGIYVDFNGLTFKPPGVSFMVTHWTVPGYPNFRSNNGSVSLTYNGAYWEQSNASSPVFQTAMITPATTSPWVHGIFTQFSWNAGSSIFQYCPYHGMGAVNIDGSMVSMNSADCWTLQQSETTSSNTNYFYAVFTAADHDQAVCGAANAGGIIRIQFCGAITGAANDQGRISCYNIAGAYQANVRDTYKWIDSTHVDMINTSSSGLGAYANGGDCQIGRIEASTTAPVQGTNGVWQKGGPDTHYSYIGSAVIGAAHAVTSYGDFFNPSAVADGKSFLVNNTLTIAGTDGALLTFQGSDTYVGRATTDTLLNKTMVAPALGTPASVNLANATNLPVGSITGMGIGMPAFLATPSSANLAATVTDETGSGALAFATSPTLVTPTLGVAVATTINKLTITAPASGSTLTVADGKTLTASNSLTFAGTDGTTQTFQASDTIMGRATTDTMTNKTYDSGGTGNVFKLNGVTISTATSLNQELFTNSNLAESTVASASPLVLTGVAGPRVNVTGTVNFAAVTAPANSLYIIRFSGVLTMTNGINLALPGGANITTAAQDTAVLVTQAANVARIISYNRAALTPDTAPAASPTFSGTITAPDASTWNSSGLTMAQPIGMGNKNISALAAVSSNNASGYQLVAGAASSTGPTLVPNRAGATTGIGAQAAGNISMIAAATEMMRITSTLITLPTIGTDATHTDSTVCQDTTTHALYFGSGTAGICLGTSSARFKTAIFPLDEGIAQILELKAKRYRYIPGYQDSGAREQFGFLAEDVIHVLPKLVGLDAEGKPNSVDLVGMVPVLVNAAQELSASFDAMVARQRAIDDRVANLEGRLGDLEAVFHTLPANDNLKSWIEPVTLKRNGTQ